MIEPYDDENKDDFGLTNGADKISGGRFAITADTKYSLGRTANQDNKDENNKNRNFICFESEYLSRFHLQFINANHKTTYVDLTTWDRFTHSYFKLRAGQEEEIIPYIGDELTKEYEYTFIQAGSYIFSFMDF